VARGRLLRVGGPRGSKEIAFLSFLSSPLPRLPPRASPSPRRPPALSRRSSPALEGEARQQARQPALRLARLGEAGGGGRLASFLMAAQNSALDRPPEPSMSSTYPASGVSVDAHRPVGSKEAGLQSAPECSRMPQSAPLAASGPGEGGSDAAAVLGVAHCRCCCGLTEHNRCCSRRRRAGSGSSLVRYRCRSSSSSSWQQRQQLLLLLLLQDMI
jgi:hypothetical protein